MSDDNRLAEVWALRAQELGVSQADAARALGFRSQAAVSQYLSGRVPLGLDAACRFARFLKVPLARISESYAELVSEALLGEADDVVRRILVGHCVTDGNARLFFDNASQIDGDGTYLIELKGERVVVSVESDGDNLLVASSDRSFSLPKESADVLVVRGKAVVRLIDLCQH